MGQHSDTPLVGDIMLYYTLASVHVIKHFVIMLIPFDSAEDSHIYSLIPFPMLLNNTPVIWNDVQHNFMLSKTKQLITFINDLEKDCVLLFGKYICNIDLFQGPTQNFPRIKSLISSTPMENGVCDYTKYTKPLNFQMVGTDVVFLQTGH